MDYEEVKSNRRMFLSKEGLDAGGLKVVPLFQDSSWKTLISLADSDIHLEVHIAKVTSRGLKAEVRTLKAIQKDIQNAAKKILELRARLRQKAPEVLQEI
ncbi:hypothetical protein LCGC14_1024330 [marine sediment metagenome]|uniref:Uncharacterized protein n=1 Tax=marine sediment metagenome TaxID=412755 RepID=A0A0F9N113_9ZZZZ